MLCAPLQARFINESECKIAPVALALFNSSSDLHGIEYGKHDAAIWTKNHLLLFIEGQSGLGHAVWQLDLAFDSVPGHKDDDTVWSNLQYVSNLLSAI